MAGTEALVHVSAVAGEVMAPERMAGALAVAPIRTHTDDDGQAICDSEVTGLPPTVGSVSLANFAEAVVAAYITSGTVPAPLVPVPVSRQSPDDGHVRPFRLATVVPVGKVSAVKATVEVPRPLAAMPPMTIGPLAPAPILPTPMAMHPVSDGHASEEREVRVNPVKESLVQGAATPALPKPPEMAIGVPELGVLVVPMATQPVPALGQTRLVSPVMLAGMLAGVQESTPSPEIVSTRTTAPVAVVPIATHVVADGHAICDSEVTPVRAEPVEAVASEGVAGLASTITPVLTPPTRLYPTPSHSTVPAHATAAMRVVGVGRLTADQVDRFDQVTTAPLVFSPVAMQVI